MGRNVRVAKQQNYPLPEPHGQCYCFADDVNIPPPTLAARSISEDASHSLIPHHCNPLDKLTNQRKANKIVCPHSQLSGMIFLLWRFVMKRISTLVLILCACFVSVAWGQQPAGTCNNGWTEFHRPNMERWNPCEKVLNVKNVGKPHFEVELRH